MFLVIVTNQLLIQRKIHLMGSNGAFIIFGHIDLVNYFFQRSKILLNRLIHQNITVSKIQNLSFQSTLQHTINDLKSRISFSCTSSHNKQQTILPSCNGIYGSVNGNSLIVTRWICILTAVIRLFNYCLLCWCHSRFLFKARNQFQLCRKFIHFQLTFFSSKEIMFCESISIRTVCKRKIKHSGIGHSLLQPMRNTVLIVFRFNNSNRIICVQI